MSSTISTISENAIQSEPVDLTKHQYSGDRTFYMTRRMSGMPILDRLNKSYPTLEPNVLDRLNELLVKFPEPPTSVVLPAGTGQQPSHSSGHKLSGGWGSIRGIAEKFNVFNKSS